MKEKKYKEYVEKRQYKRNTLLKLQCKIKIVSGKDPALTSSPFVVDIENLSLNGMCVELHFLEMDGLHISFNYEKEFPIRNYLEIELYIPEDVNPIKAQGVVEWYEKDFTKEIPVYKAGISFTKMTDKDKEKLKSYLKSQGLRIW